LAPASAYACGVMGTGALASAEGVMALDASARSYR
jgi:hypothetical protein